MLSAFSVERCPPSRWNTVRHQHGIVSAIAWNTQLDRSDGLAVWVVHHPAAVLRRAESGAPDMAAWVRALAGAWPEAATFDARIEEPGKA